MKIGIDISQLAYPETGVSSYLVQLVEHLVKNDSKNEYVLFYSSLRRNFQFSIFKFQSSKNVQYRIYRFPLKFLDLLWNKLHVMPIEIFTGEVDVFITSDWVEPPTQKATKATILYDLIVYTKPEETDRSIINTQKRKLAWVIKESSAIFCISESTKKDAITYLKIDEHKLKIAYPAV